MKKHILSIIFVFVFLLSLFSPFSSYYLKGDENRDSQETREIEQKPIVEDVTVTNIEVPVRVLCEGKPVAGLTRDDFALFENKKRVNINGFFPKRKKLEVKTTTSIIPAEEQFPVRTFVLVFKLTEYNEHIEQAVDHLFENVFRTNDRILVFANEKTAEYQDLREKETIKQELLNLLRTESHKAKQELLVYINKVESMIDLSSFDQLLNHGYKLSVRLENFLKQYSRTWHEYKNKYLIPNIDRFYLFSRYLEKVKGEKWVLNFYQFDLFPNIRLSSKFANYIRDILIGMLESKDYGDQSIAKLCETLLDDIMYDMAISKGFPIEEVSKLFYKANATFHSFFIRTMNKGNANEIDYVEVSSDVEQTLKRITYFTGGKSITSNDLVQSIVSVSEEEDVYYILSYAPRDKTKAGKLAIKVREPQDKEYQVLYDDNFNADYIKDYFKTMEKQIEVPEIKVTDFSFRDKILAFSVKNYRMRAMDDKTTVGRMKIRISVFNKDDNSSLFDQEKVLTAQKEKMTVSIGAFKTLKGGEYNFVINAQDLFTGKEDVLHQSISVR